MSLSVGRITVLCHFRKYDLMPVIICKNYKHLVIYYNMILRVKEKLLYIIENIETVSFMNTRRLNNHTISMSTSTSTKCYRFQQEVVAIVIRAHHSDTVCKLE